MIQLKDLTLGYEQRTLLEKVSAHITGGQLVALLGRNGTGKSTLLRAVMGLEKPQNGEIILHGNNIASLKPEELARNISFVTTDKVRIANLRCRDVVALGRAPYTNWLGQLQGEDKEKGGQRHAPGRHGQLCGKDDGQNVRRRMPTHHDSPCPCTGHSCHPARRTYRLP